MSITEKVHTLRNPGIKPKGAPEPWEKARAFDKVNPKTGARPDRSVLRNRDSEKGKYYAIEFSDEEDFIMVRVEGDGKEFSYGKSVPYGKDHEKDPWTEYYGVNVLFFPDGTIDAHTSDPTSKKQWSKDKDKIIKVAKDSLKDKDLPAIYDGLGGKSRKRGTGKLSFDPDSKADREHSDYHGYHDKKTNEMLTFKEFLLVEAAEDRGWFKNKKDWNAAVAKIAVDDDGVNVNGDCWARYEGKLVAKWFDADDEGWVESKASTNEGKKGKFGVKLGGVYEETPEVGFEDRLNFEKAKSECKDAGIAFKTTSNFGIHYIIFNSEADQKKAVRLIKKVIDKSVESEW